VPGRGDLHLPGHQYGLLQFTLDVRIPPAPGSSANWNLGVQVGPAMHLITYRPMTGANEG
jgi:hypothetical protein